MSADSATAVLVVNYGSSALLAEALVDLGRETTSTIVVVDNFTDARERERMQELAAREEWELLQPAGNLGFGAGMNLAAARAIELGAGVLVLLNPDARLEASALAAISAAVRAQPERAVSPTVLRPDGTVWFAGSDLRLTDGRIRSPRRRSDDDDVFPWLSGACLGVSSELWSRVGGFDESYFLYWEDVDLSWRIVEQGGALAVLNDVTVVHDEGGTHLDAASRPEAKSATYYYFNIRNRLLFAKRNLDDRGLRAWRANDVRVAFEILLQGGRRQFLAPRAPLTAAFRGVRDGRRLLVAPAPTREGVLR